MQIATHHVLAATIPKKLCKNDKLQKLSRQIKSIRPKFESRRIKFEWLMGREMTLVTGLVRKLTASAVAVALVAIPTGVTAGSPAPAPQPNAQQAAAAASANPWLTLSAMSGSSSSAATAAAAAQGEKESDFPPIAPLVVILGTIALDIWILLHDGGGNGDGNGNGNGGGGRSSGLLGGIIGPLGGAPISPS